jgi:hypothetical protein
MIEKILGGVRGLETLWERSGAVMEISLMCQRRAACLVRREASELRERRDLAAAAGSTDIGAGDIDRGVVRGDLEVEAGRDYDIAEDMMENARDEDLGAAVERGGSADTETQALIGGGREEIVTTGGQDMMDQEEADPLILEMIEIEDLGNRTDDGDTPERPRHFVFCFGYYQNGIYFDYVREVDLKLSPDSGLFSCPLW